jgi:tRNA nucleotidyltransferase/poly(A) polymerase
MMYDVKKSVLELIESSEIISTLVEIAAREGLNLYLVGGFLRDLFGGQKNKDVDLVSPQVGDLTEYLKKETAIRPVLIDRKFGTIRLVPPSKCTRDWQSYQIDLSPMRGFSIEDDLNQRDFTMNALAINLAGWEKTGVIKLIDPLGGLSDLRSGRLRACTHLSIKDDPLRILRAYRLVSTCGFSIESKTREWIVRMRQGLDKVAKERIRDELALILSAPNSASTIRLLDEDNMIDLLLPECEPLRDLREDDFHHLDFWSHTLSTLDALEGLLANPQELLTSYVEEAQTSLAQKLIGGRTRETMLKIGVLAHDIGKPSCQTVDKNGVIHFHGHEVAGAQAAASLCRRLRFSNEEIDFTTQLVRQHMSATRLFNLADPSRRTLGRFFRLGPGLFWPLIMLFASDHMATLGPRSPKGGMVLLRERILSWLDYYRQWLKPREVEPPLVNGHDIIEHLHLSPGPKVGKLLEVLTELQWEGEINSREAALKCAARLLKEWNGSRQ